MADPAPDKGHSRHSGYARDGLDWYVEPPFVVDQLFAHEDFSGHLIWDPSCGRGTILDRAQAHGFDRLGSDVVDRGAGARHPFYPADFLCLPERVMLRAPLAIVCNPPYGRLEPAMPRGDSYAERFIRRAIGATPAAKVAMLVQGKLLWSERRWRLFHEDHPPTQLLFCSDRPSMPPGEELPRLIAEGRAFEGGAIDYLWMLWVRGEAPRPPAWLRPRGLAAASHGDRLFSEGGSE